MIDYRQGDVLEQLAQMKAEGVKVRTCVTSPPYWGLRDYGTGQWRGGDVECDHATGRFTTPVSEKQASNFGSGTMQYRDVCGKCGAVRVDNQIGLERTPDEYVAKMVQVFRGVRDVLTDDGTLWLNLGDSYTGNATSGSAETSKLHEPIESFLARKAQLPTKSCEGLKPKDLVGIPWRVAFALQADGWYLRSDIIWHKPNPMPESVRDRPTKSHEYIFLLSKSPKYFYDADAVREPFTTADPTSASYRKNGKSDSRKKHSIYCHACDGSGDGVNGENGDDCEMCGGTGRANIGMAKTAVKNDGFWKPEGMGRNRRSVWTVTTKPYRGAHFATFPPDLIEPCILAGSERGDLVLDPFGGSGTTAEVAIKHGRRAILIELNPQYVELQRARLAKYETAQTAPLFEV